jgi:hypothetical protein
VTVRHATVRHVGGGLAALLLVHARAASVAAQAPSVASAAGGGRVVPELRLDAFVGRTTGAQLGLGAAFDAGSYTRLAIVVGAGGERRAGGTIVGVQRAEAIARFHFDPLRQTRHGVYAGGGVGVRHAPGSPLRALLVAMLGVEGPRHGGTVVAVEAGVGGGARLGIALRGARAQRR